MIAATPDQVQGRSDARYRPLLSSQTAPPSRADRPHAYQDQRPPIPYHEGIRRNHRDFQHPYDQQTGLGPGLGPSASNHYYQQQEPSPPAQGSPGPPLTVEHLQQHNQSAAVPDTPGPPRSRQSRGGRHGRRGPAKLPFYEAVHLLHCLNPVRGKHRKRVNLAESNPDDPRELLREFLDAVCCICDRKYAGKTVTSAALLKDPEGPRLVLCSNKTLDEGTIPALKDILRDAEDIAGNPGNLSFEKVKTKKIFEATLDLGKARLLNYANGARKRLEALLESEEHLNKFQQRSRKFLKHLHYIVSETSDLIALVDSCTREARSQNMRELARAFEQAQPEAQLLGIQLRHYICRIGSHFRITMILKHAAKVLPGYGIFFYDLRSRIEQVEPLRGSISLKVINAQTIMKDILPGHAEAEKYQQKLSSYIVKFRENGVQEGIELKKPYNHALRDGMKGQVHAEVRLIDHIRKMEREGQATFFFNEDRYVSCSKGACYLCGLYVDALKQVSRGQNRFDLRGRHDKLWPSWIQPQDREASNEGSDIRGEMLRVIQNDIKRHLDTGGAPLVPYHPDSSTGLSGIPEIRNDNIQVDRRTSRYASPPGS